MSKFFDYDPFTGLQYHTEDGDGDDITVHASQNLDPILDTATRVRNSGDADKGISRDLWAYCTIPAWLEIELLSKGLNIHDKNCTKDLLREINTNYPNFKYTRLHHE